MSPTYPDVPPMTQLSIDHQTRPSRSPPSSTTYPRSIVLPRPPTAYMPRQHPSHSRNLSNEPHNHIGHQGSVSSDGSASTSPSICKSYPSRIQAQPYQLSPPVERDFMGDRSLSGEGNVRTYPGSRHKMSPRQQSVDGDVVAIHQYLRQEDNDSEEDHAIWVLIWLSFFDPAFSLFSAIFSVVVVISLLLVSPIRLCKPSCSIGTSAIRTIAPIFRNHLRLIHAPSAEEAHNFDFRPVLLVLIHVVSPLLSIGVAAAAWTSAAFWLFALMMGNPDGTERRDDGRAAVLAVRDWWEKLLLHAVR